MPAAVVLAVAIGAFVVAYIVYGRRLEIKYDIDPNRKTPAHTRTDGIDYVPARAPVLMGHHFASIAGAAPIIGPVAAAAFGWAPVVLWVVLGSTLLGGVHDFSALIASVRHGGKTMGQVIETNLGTTGKRLFLVFAWSLVVLVMAVFSRSVAESFIKEPPTATSSLLFMVIAVFFGLAVYRARLPLLLSTTIGVALIVAAIVLGIYMPLSFSQVPLVVPGLGWQLAGNASDKWVFILLAYCFVASVTPVWILLQPRDYLCSFLLYAVIVAGVVGVFVANPKISGPALVGFEVEGLGTLFPILFVTVACGAISGFHSLVSAGTTAKQLDKESHARPVAYGSMLIEGALATIALITAAAMTSTQYAQYMAKGGGGAIAVFANGLAGFLSSLGIPQRIGVTFAALAISAFALTSLDTATRLGRFMFQEFFDVAGKGSILATNRYVATLATVGAASILAYSGTMQTLWPLFGSANQLLACLTLLAVSIWLAGLGKATLFLRIPMVFMFCVTLAALVLLAYKGARSGSWVVVVMALLLLGVALILVGKAISRGRTGAANGG